MSKKLPSFQFYPGDWMKDPAVRACSLEARGLWIDMLCLMHESSRRGYLQHVSGKPITPAQLARMTGCAAGEVSRLLQELEDVGVFSCTEDGTIYSRRQVRDEETRRKDNKRKKRSRNSSDEKEKDTRHADVTPLSRSCHADVTRMSHDTSVSSSVSTSEKEHPPNPPPGGSGCSDFEKQFGGTYKTILAEWKSKRESAGLPALPDGKTTSGATRIAQMIDRGEVTIDQVTTAMDHLLADEDAREKYTLTGLGNNLSNWIGERNGTDRRTRGKTAGNEAEHLRNASKDFAGL